MPKTTTVWVRLKTDNTDSLLEQQNLNGSLPLILRMRGSDSALDEDFIFPYSPREINFGALADETTQLSRPGTTPIIAFKSHRLMTVDFTALIAHPLDGLSQSVDKEIFALRRFASSSDKVFELKNYDLLTSAAFAYRNMSESKNTGLFFSITEMSIAVVRRNKDNEITQANVTLSLIENRNPKINIAYIPPLPVKVEQKKCKNKKWAKKNPTKCKKKEEDPPKSPLASALAIARAKDKLDAQRGDCKKIAGSDICP